MRSLSVINPATGRRIASLPTDDASSVRRKFAAARAAQPAWAERPLAERLAIIGRFRRAIIAQTDALALTLTTETGKPITQARNELNGLIPRLDFFLAESPRALRAERVYRDRKARL